jgi:leucyl/phenylalanyl-tRNA---protein transferase
MRSPLRLTPEILLKAYQAGIFPMAESADDPELFWVDPAHRGILPLEAFHVPRRLRRVVLQDRFEVRVDSVECWQHGVLVGGLYGVSIGGAFFGESMFSRVADASKVALVHLVALMRMGGYRLLDLQFVTPHLAQFGAIEVPRSQYRLLLVEALRYRCVFPRRVGGGVGGGVGAAGAGAGTLAALQASKVTS